MSPPSMTTEQSPAEATGGYIDDMDIGNYQLIGHTFTLGGRASSLVHEAVRQDASGGTLFPDMTGAAIGLEFRVPLA
jgi:hypothetical protein